MNALTQKVVQKISNICKKPKRYIEGTKFINIVKRAKSDNQILVFFTSLIGDTVLSMTCIEEYMVENPEKKIILIGNKYIPQWYSYLLDNCEFIYLDQYLAKHGLTKNNFDGFYMTSSLNEKGLSLGIINPLTCHYKNCKRAKNKSTYYQMRNHIFMINKSNVITKPKPRINDFLMTKYKSKTVIINPYTTSIMGNQLIIYQKIATFLIDNGYEVYTNVLENQAELNGTKRLECSLDKVFYLAPKVTFVVSVRSGFVDFLQFSGANIFCVYENITQELYEMWSLKQWNQSGKIEEVYLSLWMNNDSKEEFVLKKLSEFQKNFE